MTLKKTVEAKASVKSSGLLQKKDSLCISLFSYRLIPRFFVLTIGGSFAPNHTLQTSPTVPHPEIGDSPVDSDALAETQNLFDLRRFAKQEVTVRA